MPPDRDPAPPPRIPDYELLRLIGRGSYGDVWLARGVTGVFRAVKIVWRNRFDDERPYTREFEGVTRFAAISLREPSQLALLHAGRSDDGSYFFYVMELADDVERGRAIDPERYVAMTLREYTRRGRLPTEQVVTLGVALARALGTLHREGLVHRDIKPSNVVLVGGVPKLADIGLVTAASTGLTVVGTQGYMPPEGPGAASADVYGIGKVLYELASGLDRQEWPRLPPDLDALPDRKPFLELNEVLIRACAVNAAERFSDANALLEELLLLQAGKSVRRLRQAELRTTQALRIAAVLGLAAALAAGGMWLEHQRAAEAEADRDYTTKIVLTRQALAEGDFARSRALLQEIEKTPRLAKRRNLETAILEQQAHGDPARVLRASGRPVEKLALSPKGNLLAVHDDSPGVALFDTTSGAEIGRASGMKLLAGFSADGQWLMGSTVDGQLQRWRVPSLQPEPAKKTPGGLRVVGTQGSDRVLAIAATNPLAVVVWDFAAQREVQRVPIGDRVPADPWEFFSAASDPDGRQVVVGATRSRGAVASYRVTYVRLDDEPLVVSQADSLRPNSAGFIAGPDNTQQAWVAERTTTRAVVFDAGRAQWSTAPFQISPRTTDLVSAGTGADAALLAARDALVVENQPGTKGSARTFRGHAGKIVDLVAAPDGTRFYSAGVLGEVREWERSSPNSANVARQGWNSRATPNHVIFSADSTRLYQADDGKSIAILDTATLKTIGQIPGALRPLADTPEGLWTVAADSRALQVWRDGQQRAELGRDTAAIFAASVAANGRVACFTRPNGDLYRVELGQPGAQLVAKGQRELYALQLDATGTQVWAASSRRALLCLALPDGRQIAKFDLPAMVSNFCFTVARDRLAVTVENGDIHLYDNRTATRTAQLFSGSASPQAVASTADGGRLIAAGADGKLHIVHSETGLVLVDLNMGGSEEPPHNMSIAPDGAAIATIGKAGMLRIVRVPERADAK